MRQTGEGLIAFILTKSLPILFGSHYEAIRMKLSDGRSSALTRTSTSSRHALSHRMGEGFASPWRFLTSS